MLLFTLNERVEYEMARETVERRPICQGSNESQFFSKSRKRDLPAMMSQFELDAELLSTPVFQQHPIDPDMLYQSGSTCLPLMAKRFTSASCLAAFNGNLPALNTLLGEALLEPLDISQSCVVHFLALGGQNEVLLSLVKTYGTDILTSTDLFGHSLLHFAALGMNITLIEILLEEFQLTLKATNNFGQSWLDMLADRKISEENLLILSYVIADKDVLKETTEKLSADSFDLTNLDFIPNFAGQFDIKNPDSLIQLIIAVVKEIVVNRKSHFDPYLCYLISYQRLNNDQKNDHTGSNAINI